MTEIRAASIMRTDIPYLSPETPIRRAVALLVDSRSAAAPVRGSDDRLEGILTQKDCFRPALQASYYREWKGSVSDHMTRDVVAIEAGDDLLTAAEMFLVHPHRVFPVLEDGKIVGLLHRSDVLSRLTSLG